MKTRCNRKQQMKQDYLQKQLSNNKRRKKNKIKFCQNLDFESQLQLVGTRLLIDNYKSH